MSENTGVLACQCGRCRLELCDPRMRYRSECLCFDCRQRGLQFESRRSENRLPAAVIDYERGIDLFYFANAFLVDDATRELLTFSKLREDAFNTTAMSTCCGTLICGTHPIYQGASVSVNADSCRVSVPSVMPSQMVTFGCDCPAGKYQEILERRDVPMFFSVYDETDREEMLAFLKVDTEPLAKRYERDGYVTFEQLCADRTIAIDDSFFAESRRSETT